MEAFQHHATELETWSRASLKWIRGKSENKEQIQHMILQMHGAGSSSVQSGDACLFRQSKEGESFLLSLPIFVIWNCLLRGFWEDLKLNKITHVKASQTIKSYLLNSFFSSEREGGWGWQGRKMGEENRENWRRRKDGDEGVADCRRPRGWVHRREARAGNAHSCEEAAEGSLLCPLPCTSTFLFPSSLALSLKLWAGHSCCSLNPGIKKPKVYI